MAACSPSINFLSRPARSSREQAIRTTKEKRKEMKGKGKEDASERWPMRFYPLFSVRTHLLLPFARPTFVSPTHASHSLFAFSLRSFNFVSSNINYLWENLKKDFLILLVLFLLREKPLSRVNSMPLTFSLFVFTRRFVRKSSFKKR